MLTGILEMQLPLSDQPSYGTWAIRVEGFVSSLLLNFVYSGHIEKNLSCVVFWIVFQVKSLSRKKLTNAKNKESSIPLIPLTYITCDELFACFLYTGSHLQQDFYCGRVL